MPVDTLDVELAHGCKPLRAAGMWVMKGSREYRQFAFGLPAGADFSLRG